MHSVEPNPVWKYRHKEKLSYINVWFKYKGRRHFQLFTGGRQTSFMDACDLSRENIVLFRVVKWWNASLVKRRQGFGVLVLRSVSTLNRPGLFNTLPNFAAGSAVNRSDTPPQAIAFSAWIYIQHFPYVINT